MWVRKLKGKDYYALESVVGDILGLELRLEDNMLGLGTRLGAKAGDRLTLGNRLGAKARE